MGRKLSNLYNLDSFQKFLDCGKKVGFTDASSGVVLARNLTAVDPKIFEQKFPELTFLNSGISLNNFGGYARKIQSLKLVEQGGFTDSTDRDDVKGLISLQAEDSYLPVFSKEAHSFWTEDEVKEADLQNINLVQQYLKTHNKVYQQIIDTIGFVGHGAISSGLLNYSGFTSTTATAPSSSATAKQLYDDISGLIQAQWNSVYNTPEYMATKVVMPTSVYNSIQAKILDSAAGSSTVLKALKDNHPSIDFIATAKANSVGGTSRTVAFSISSDVMSMRIPVPLTISEIFKRGFKYGVESGFRVAGLDVLEDSGGYILTGL